MSNRSMLEFNHDLTPRDSEAQQRWAEQLVQYLTSGNRELLPYGVTYFNIRHHSEDCPLGEPPYGWDNQS